MVRGQVWRRLPVSIMEVDFGGWVVEWATPLMIRALDYELRTGVYVYTFY